MCTPAGSRKANRQAAAAEDGAPEQPLAGCTCWCLSWVLSCLLADLHFQGEGSHLGGTGLKVHFHSEANLITLVVCHTPSHALG